MSLDKELVDTAKKYAKLKYSSVTQIVRDYFLQLKCELETEGFFTSDNQRSELNDSPQTSEAETE
jgi:hypothetical protein